MSLQVDMLLVDDALFAHPKVTNPTATEVPGYCGRRGSRIGDIRSYVWRPADCVLAPRGGKGGRALRWPLTPPRLEWSRRLRSHITDVTDVTYVADITDVALLPGLEW